MTSPFIGVAKSEDWDFLGDIGLQGGVLVVANANSSAALVGAAKDAFDEAHPDNALFAVALSVSDYAEGDGPLVSIKGGPRTQIPVGGDGIAAALVQGGSGSGFVLDTNTAAYSEEYRIAGINPVRVA